MNHCLRHFEEPPAGTCRTCHQPFCTRCLVWALGPKKPPFCVACALSASGVRPSHRTVVGGGAPVEAASEVPTVDKRTARAERRAEREAIKRAGRAQRRHGRRGGNGGGDDPAADDGPGEDRVEDLGTGAAPDSRVPAPSQLAAALRSASVPRGLMGAD